MVDNLVHSSKSLLISLSPLPASPPSRKHGFFLHSISQKRQFEGPQEVVCFWNIFQAVRISRNQILMPYLPRGQATSMLSIRQFTSYWFGHNNTWYPHAMYASTILSMLFWNLVEFHKAAVEDLTDPNTQAATPFLILWAHNTNNSWP